MSVLQLLGYIFLIGLASGLQCKDPNDKAVDWFFIYKLPTQESNANKLVEKGTAFIYLTSSSNSEWIASDVAINDSKSMVAHTLNPLFAKQSDDHVYILYNDQPPYGTSSESKGHTKGVVLADAQEGIWLIHSVPHFPYSLTKYEYPAAGLRYGQSFLCVSLNLPTLDKVGVQLQYNNPHLYAQKVPKSFQSNLPNIYKAANNETINKSPWYNIETIITSGGANFTSFAKSGKFDKDLYTDLVSVKLKSNLYVETWPNEPHRLPSDCNTTYEVQNILSITVPEIPITFKTTTDHSKWAVSAPEDALKWICLGDINRAEKQTERGGGTTCLKNEKIVKQYQKIVSSVQPCQNEEFYEVIHLRK